MATGGHGHGRAPAHGATATGSRAVAHRDTHALPLQPPPLAPTRHMAYKATPPEILERGSPELIRAGVTTRHFLRNLFGTRDENPTCSRSGPQGHQTGDHRAVPRGEDPYPPGYRGLHRLVPREDGKPRCVACYMCATTCPAQCIYIEAGEYGRGERSPSHREVPDAVRHRRAALHRLRLVRGGVPQGRHPHGLRRARPRAIALRRSGTRSGSSAARPSRTRRTRGPPRLAVDSGRKLEEMRARAGRSRPSRPTSTLRRQASRSAPSRRRRGSAPSARVGDRRGSQPGRGARRRARGRWGQDGPRRAGRRAPKVRRGRKTRGGRRQRDRATRRGSSRRSRPRALVDLGRLHRLEQGTRVIPVLVSLQRWTPFYWDQERFGCSSRSSRCRSVIRWEPPRATPWRSRGSPRWCCSRGTSCRPRLAARGRARGGRAARPRAGAVAVPEYLACQPSRSRWRSPWRGWSWRNVPHGSMGSERGQGLRSCRGPDRRRALPRRPRALGERGDRDRAARARRRSCRATCSKASPRQGGPRSPRARGVAARRGARRGPALPAAVPLLTGNRLRLAMGTPPAERLPRRGPRCSRSLAQATRGGATRAALAATGVALLCTRPLRPTSRARSSARERSSPPRSRMRSSPAGSVGWRRTRSTGAISHRRRSSFTSRPCRSSPSRSRACPGSRPRPAPPRSRSSPRPRSRLRRAVASARARGHGSRGRGAHRGRARGGVRSRRGRLLVGVADRVARRARRARARDRAARVRPHAPREPDRAGVEGAAPESLRICRPAGEEEHAERWLARSTSGRSGSRGGAGRWRCWSRSVRLVLQAERRQQHRAERRVVVVAREVRVHAELGAERTRASRGTSRRRRAAIASPSSLSE